LHPKLLTLPPENPKKVLQAKNSFSFSINFLLNFKIICIMKKLNFNQMEVLYGGQSLAAYEPGSIALGGDELSKSGNNLSCAFSIAGTVGAFVGLVFLTGGAAALVAAGCFIIAPSAAALSCAHLKKA
jgi:hypothetical protein